MPIDETDDNGAGADSESDCALALRTLAGQSNAFSPLVERYQTSVFQVCYRLMGERQAAEDLTQEAFVRAYQRLHTFDCALPFGPWVRRIAANVCLNALERKQPLLFSLDDDRTEIDAASDHNDPALLYDHAETVEIIRQAILALPPHYRIVIELCHMQDLSYGEAADTLNLPLSHVKSHLFRARKHLATQLRQLRFVSPSSTKDMPSEPKTNTGSDTP